MKPYKPKYKSLRKKILSLLCSYNWEYSFPQEVFFLADKNGELAGIYYVHDASFTVLRQLYIYVGDYEHENGRWMMLKLEMNKRFRIEIENVY